MTAKRLDHMLLPLAALCIAGGASAQAASPNQGLLGDWGGERTRLYQAGVDFQLSVLAEPAYNLRGGERRLWRSAGQAVLGATFDLDKLLGVNQAKVQITLTDREGRNLSADADLGTLMQVQQVYGRGNVLRLTELSYQQSFLDDRLDLKFGRMGVGADFFAWSCLYMNLSFCGSLPGNIVSTWVNWPVSQWAGRLKIGLAPEWTLQLGVYQINPALIDPDNALKLNPAGTVGALFPLELAWSPRLGAQRLPGSWRIGGWYDNSSQPDVFLAANGQPQALNPGLPPLQRSGERGWYLNVQQQMAAVDGDASRGPSLFFNLVQADRDTATISQLLSLGLLYNGPFASRPKDIAGFAVGRTQVNPRVAEGQQLQNANGQAPAVPVQDAEYPLEIFYSAALTPWLTLGPALQWIYRPGGTASNDNVLVIGFNLALTF